MGVLEPPREEDIDGIEVLLRVLELRLAERELPRLALVFLLNSDLDRFSLGDWNWWNCSQNCSVGSRSLRLGSPSRSREFPGDIEVEKRCFLFLVLGVEGVDLGELPLGTIFPIEARAATSKAETAVRVEILELVSTYMAAAICWLKDKAWSAETGAFPDLASEDSWSLSDLRSDWHPTRTMGADGATARISGHQKLRAEKRLAGSEIL